jgi:hypothetical protein
MSRRTASRYRPNLSAIDMQEIIIQLIPQIHDDASKLQCALHIAVQDVLELQILHTYSGTCFREAQSVICSLRSSVMSISSNPR